MTTVSIIIANWNTKEFLRGCLDSIPEACGSLSYEIIVVDNASTDGSTDFIKEKYPNVKLLANRTNEGFAAACNMAGRAARGKYFFLLNPDTILLKESILKLTEFIKSQPWAGAVGPLLQDSTGRVVNSARRFYTMKLALIRDTVLGKLMPWIRTPRQVKGDSPIIVDSISGGAMLMKGELWKELHGMDTRYFMFYEDMDICRRIKEMGYNVFYMPAVKITHIGGGSRHKDRSAGLWYFTKSKLLYFEKFYPRWSVLLFKVIYKPLFLLELGMKNPLNVRYNAGRDFLKKRLLSFLSL